MVKSRNIYQNDFPHNQLPSGTKSFNSRIVDDGKYVERKVQLGNLIFDVEILHWKWLQPKTEYMNQSISSIERYHPKILQIESALTNIVIIKIHQYIRSPELICRLMCNRKPESIISTSLKTLHSYIKMI